jgi:hypothetical protein
MHFVMRQNRGRRESAEGAEAAEAMDALARKNHRPSGWRLILSHDEGTYLAPLKTLFSITAITCYKGLLRMTHRRLKTTRKIAAGEPGKTRREVALRGIAAHSFPPGQAQW